MPSIPSMQAFRTLTAGILLTATAVNAQQQPLPPAVPQPAPATAPNPAPATVAAAGSSVAEIEARLQRVERVLDNQVLLEMLRSLDQMQAEVRELRGEIEQQTNELDVLKQRQRDLYLDSDRRLRELEIGAAAVSSAPATDAAEMTSDASAPTPAIQAPVTPPAADDAATTAAESAPTQAADPNKEREAYTAAFDQLKAGRYQPAIDAFKEFLGDYPDGRYAANAQYWLGEANYVSRNFGDALEQFRQVLARFPASPKVADARLKIGYTYYELEDWDEARRTLEELVRDYPNSSVARLAQQRIIRLKNEGH